MSCFLFTLYFAFSPLQHSCLHFDLSLQVCLHSETLVRCGVNGGFDWVWVTTSCGLFGVDGSLFCGEGTLFCGEAILFCGEAGFFCGVEGGRVIVIIPPGTAPSNSIRLY